MYKVGQEVRVTNPDYTYLTYQRFIEKYGAKCLSKYRFDYCPERGDVGYIFNIEKHEHRDELVAIVDAGDRAFMIGLLGIEAVDEKEVSQ